MLGKWLVRPSHADASKLSVRDMQVPQAHRLCWWGREILRGQDPDHGVALALEELQSASLGNWFVLRQIHEGWLAVSPKHSRGNSSFQFYPWADRALRQPPPEVLAKLARGESFVESLPQMGITGPENLLGKTSNRVVLVPLIVDTGLVGAIMGLFMIQNPDPVQELIPSLGELAKDYGLGRVRQLREGRIEALEVWGKNLVRAIPLALRWASAPDFFPCLEPSPEAERLFGSWPQTGPLDHVEVLQRIHPDDRAKVQQAWTLVAQGKLEEDEVPFRILGRSGVADRWVREKLRGYRHTDSGQVSQIIAWLEDESARQNQVRSQQRYHHLVTMADQPMFVVRGNGRIEWWNETAGAFLGLGPFQEGTQHHILNHFREGIQERVLQEMLQSALSREHWSGQAALYHGTTREAKSVSLAIRPFPGSDPKLPLENQEFAFLAVDTSELQDHLSMWRQSLEAIRQITELVSYGVPEGGLLKENLLALCAKHMKASLVLYAEAQGSGLYPKVVHSALGGLGTSDLHEINLLEWPEISRVWRSGSQTDMVFTPLPQAERMGLVESVFMALPIQVGALRTGFLVLIAPVCQQRVLSESERLIFQLVARCLSGLLERQSYRARMDEALSQAQTASTAKGHFLAMMSHEIRTPLNAVVGFATLLEHSHLTTDQQEAVRTIRTSASTLVRLLGDILDFSKLESAELNLDVTAVEVRTLVEDVLEMFAPVAAERGVELVGLVDQAVPQYLDLDEARLRQILTNLVSNAIKFTYEGLIEVSLGVESVDRINRADHAHHGFQPRCQMTLQGAVRDTGLGMTAAELDKLFQPFQQLDSSRTRQHGGTGLGLVICRKLCQLMGGEISVRSTKGLGTTFAFHLEVSSRSITPGDGLLMTPNPDNPAPTIAGRSAILVTKLPELRQALAQQIRDLGLVILAELDDLRKYDEKTGVPDVVVGCEENLIHQGGIGIIRQRMGAVPLILLNQMGGPIIRSEKSGTPHPDRTNLFNNLRVYPLTRPVRREALAGAFLMAFRSSPDDSQQPLTPVTHLEELAQRYPLRILVVEDNPTNLRVLLLLLANLGYDPSCVVNGQEAVDAVMGICHDPSRAYELVLMDVHMPVMDGLDAVRTIRRQMDARLKDLPPSEDVNSQQAPEILVPYISALTADALAGDQEKCEAAGMDDYLSKPITLDGLRRVIRRAWRHLHASELVRLSNKEDSYPLQEGAKETGDSEDD